MYVDSESIKYYIKTIKKLIEQKIHIHIYSKTQHLSKEEDMKNSALLANEFFGNPYFHIEYSVDPRKLINEISKYDFGLDFVDFGKPSNYPFIFPRFNTGNRTASYLEAGIPFFVNTIYEFECRMAKEYGIGLFLDPMHDFGSFSEKLKKINYKKLERNVLKARADYNMKKQFKRLEKFIEDIRKYHKIKSKAKKASKIILVNDFGEMLMQLRDNIPTISSPNSWGLIGGAVENGESPKTALLRELKEEIPNCHVKNISFLGKMYVPELNHENYIFRGEVSDLIKNIEFTEGQKLRYFKFKKIKKLKVEKIFKNFIYDNKERIFANHEGAK
jgi:8-oxo-dGTP pyrophosphatase MutT (NUDIX family)